MAQLCGDPGQSAPISGEPIPATQIPATQIPGTQISGTQITSLQITGAQLLAWRREQLASGGSRAGLDWLLDLGGGVRWQAQQQLHLDPQRQLTLQRPLEALAVLWRRHRTTAEPLQYLLGVCPWRDLELEVAPGVLIPRQETELLVELALALAGPEAPSRWADLGTGSGCLAAALARAWPHSQGFAVERSPEALAIAQRNLQAAAPVTLLEGSWWQPLQPWWGQLDLVVSNPPYIPTAVWQQLDPGVREYEPALALDGGNDGLEALRAIAACAEQALAPGGWLVLEHHHDQSPAVLALLKAAGLEQVQAHQDLEGIWRFASARRSSAAGPKP
jgi:release factor glutamine methyltransferase